MPNPPEIAGGEPVRATTVVYPLSGDQDTNELTRLFAIDGHHRPSDALIDRFCSRYTNEATARQYRQELTALFAYCGAAHPRALTDAAVQPLGGPVESDNTRRNRLARVCTFLRWCVRVGEAEGDNSSRHRGLVVTLDHADPILFVTDATYGLDFDNELRNARWDFEET